MWDTANSIIVVVILCKTLVIIFLISQFSSPTGADGGGLKRTVGHLAIGGFGLVGAAAMELCAHHHRISTAYSSSQQPLLSKGMFDSSAQERYGQSERDTVRDTVSLSDGRRLTGLRGLRQR